MGLILDTNFVIAATAPACGHGLVTNNREEFERVPDLVVETY